MNLLLFLSLNIITLPCFGRKRETHKNRLNFTLTHGCPSVLPGYEKDFVRSDEIFLPNRSSAMPSHKRIAFLKILLQFLLQTCFTAQPGRDDARLSAAQFKSECERSLPADHAGALPTASLRICTADRLFELIQYRFSFLHRPVPHTILYEAIRFHSTDFRSRFQICATPSARAVSATAFATAAAQPG